MDVSEIIFAILLGLVAGAVGKLLMPGDDPGGVVATILLGLAGSFVGFVVFTKVLGIGDSDAFDWGGVLGAILGVMLLLGIYRAVAGRGDGRRTDTGYSS
jgi:uncharacterized membrane protein YeaQ/YmgE (transglycosylase-associated protein family)